MKRTQIQLNEKQYKLLKEISSLRNVSLAEVVREAVASYSATLPVTDKDSRIREAMSIIGKYNSGKKDIAGDHDNYLADIFADREIEKKTGKKK
jgi:hypothetical protein